MSLRAMARPTAIGNETGMPRLYDEPLRLRGRSRLHEIIGTLAH